jgi:1-hydroxycarotenoid 3,4-desaturase
MVATGRSQHVVVVGAGVGGLAAAIVLARSGLRVSIIEARREPGGKMRTLPSAAGPVDAGPTVLTMPWVFEDLFARAGVRMADRVELIRQPIIARHWWPDGSCLDLTDDVEANAALIGDFAGPAGAADFRRFHAATAALHRAFDRPVMRAPRPRILGILGAALASPATWRALLPGRSLSGFLRASFRDPRLRQLFGRYATYVGGVPGSAPAVLSLVWQAEAAGVHAVRGGMGALATALADLARECGVELRLGTAVARVLTEGGRVSGVALATGEIVAASEVVFNGDPAGLVQGLCGQAVVSAVPRRGVAPRSLSAWVWAFAAEPQGRVAQDLVLHNVFFGTDPAAEFGPIAAGRMPEDPTLYVCAQDRATAEAGTGTETCAAERFEIIMNAPPVRGAAEREEMKCRTRTFSTLARMGLSFGEHPGASALTAPADFARLHPGSDGSLYGRSPHGTAATFLRPGARTRVRGLYLAGGGAHPGAGVPMATLSGLHAAEAILTDLALPSTSRPTAMRGGMSTAFPTTGGAPSR